MKELLVVENLSKSFPGVLAVDNVSFTLYHGEILALLDRFTAEKVEEFSIAAYGFAFLQFDDCTSGNFGVLLQDGIGVSGRLCQAFPGFTLQADDPGADRKRM